ncbi:proline--tRNA ligase [Candidatus Karelsulcia muelleri]|uniref:proline--tRNA ligase n=1 Tax=Candidatus Karelsulcia muelleri TaxID=336810 RepID=UPI001951F820|nr:proline--tRNA ligase [Candidatus Karelsulcia muelleri]
MGLRDKNWYKDIILTANIAEASPIRGCIIFKPYGLEIWENIKKNLDYILKKTGHKNFYFPLLILKSDLKKEYNHIKGFAKECAIVTHSRLKFKNKKLILEEESKLKNELIIRPTSEAIIWDSFKRWIISYRDLPMLLNQWSNTIRWEMRPRFFLRNSEFFLQEGHTAHSTKKEAIRHCKQILNLYKYFIEDILSIPVIKGRKTKLEKFAGAKTTYCLEAILPDGKALQIATSHFLGKNFSRSFNVKYINKKGIYKQVWGTSWGLSTRLIGAVILTHSDKYGLIIPPKIAPIQVVIIPIYKKTESFKILEIIVSKLIIFLKKKQITFRYDNRKNYRPGWKFNEYDIQGIPIRLTIGKKEIEKGNIEVFRRDTRKRKKYKIRNLKKKIIILLKQIQKNLLKKAVKIQKDFIIKVDNYQDFKKIIKTKGGVVSSHWDGSTTIEKKIKKETSASIICIPSKSYIKNKKTGSCIYSNNYSKQRVFFAKSY